MNQQNHRVKIPCNHSLRVVELKYAKDFQVRSITGQSHKCDGCGEDSGFGYYCSSCEYGAHEECIDFPGIINLPCHSRHPLEKVSSEDINYKDGRCHFCREELGDEMYHCSLCNFSIDLYCSIDQPPRTIYQPKSHNHTFTLVARKVSFTCNACGMVGDRNPYVCFECDFMLHRDCVNLPRVININRHEHRISRTFRLSRNYWECGVCRKKVDWTFGAFSCLCCRNYVVHSKCATREDVWDGEELEDKPEIEEIERSYIWINMNEIIHFSHEHNLLRCDDNPVDYEKRLLCNACIHPINSSSFYKCMQCEFFLHEVCAMLPRMKRNILHNHKLSLLVDDKADKPYKCTYCLHFFDGFRYSCVSPYCENSKLLLDLDCSTIREPFHHELHPHPLFRTSREHKTCGACGKDSEYVLSCTVCEFALGMECATLPRKVKHRCDDHDLSLHHGAGHSNGQLWCDICEGKTDPSVWFYGCDECGVTLHIKCVIGDMYNFKPKREYLGGELVPNIVRRHLQVAFRSKVRECAHLHTAKKRTKPRNPHQTPTFRNEKLYGLDVSAYLTFASYLLLSWILEQFYTSMLSSMAEQQPLLRMSSRRSFVAS
ncbi:hypothetical protein Bca4012_019019 [Brassica carinata]